MSKHLCYKPETLICYVEPMRLRSFLPLAVFAALVAAGSARAQDAAPGEAELPAIMEEAQVGAPSPADLETIHTFGGEAGRRPRGGLVADKEGNLYGTASAGGLCDDCGLVYMLSPPADGGAEWEYRVLHRFAGGEADGKGPLGTLTVRGNAIYGTASAGAGACDCGGIFRLKPRDRARTKWDYSLLYAFEERNRGATPVAGVIFGEDGALYGATSAGGADDAGTIFRLRGGGEAWRLSVIHHFRAVRDGGSPLGELVFGENRVLFGTASTGGRFGEGTVFRLTRNGGFSAVHHFKGIRQTGSIKDGSGPEGHLTFAEDGTLYGTTARGGNADAGTIFRIRPAGEGRWVYSAIYHFAGDAEGGGTPRAGLTMDSAGELYGTAAEGGPDAGGIVYRVTRTSDGWGIETLHAFDLDGREGGAPHSRLTIREDILYGATGAGGAVARGEECPEGCGSVFQLQM